MVGIEGIVRGKRRSRTEQPDTDNKSGFGGWRKHTLNITDMERKINGQNGAGLPNFRDYPDDTLLDMLGFGVPGTFDEGSSCILQILR